jgi:hypothetical protein
VCSITRLRTPDFDRERLQAQRSRPIANVHHVEHGGATIGIRYNREPAEAGDNFAQELESFGSCISLLDRQAGDVPAGSSETCYQARADRVSN